MSLVRIDWPEAAAWRAHRHHLHASHTESNLIAVARLLCGLHAQVLSCSVLTAWARLENLEPESVHDALWRDRTLVKTWAMRGTLHLLPAHDLPLWHAALATGGGRYLREAAWKTNFGITLPELDCLTAAIAEALKGRAVTREELMRDAIRITGSAALGAKIGESSWGTILRPAAFAGQLCFAPSLGQRVRFTHPETWLAGAGRIPEPTLPPQAAAAEVTRRFLAVNGPATHHDLAHWWGGGVALARQWIASLGEEARAVDLAGTSAWVLEADLRELRGFPRQRFVRLLPGFDQYTVAASLHAGHLLPGDYRSRVFRPQGWISPVLLVNGFLMGIWRHEWKRGRVEVTIEPFVELTRTVRRAAEREAGRLAAFLGGELSLAWKD